MTDGSPPHDIKDAQYGYNVKCLSPELMAEVERKDQQRQQALDSFIFSSDRSQVKCQQCKQFIAMYDKAMISGAIEFTRLNARIRAVELRHHSVLSSIAVV